MLFKVFGSLIVIVSFLFSLSIYVESQNQGGFQGQFSEEQKNFTSQQGQARHNIQAFQEEAAEAKQNLINDSNNDGQSVQTITQTQISTDPGATQTQTRQQIRNTSRCRTGKQALLTKSENFAKQNGSITNLLDKLESITDETIQTKEVNGENINELLNIYETYLGVRNRFNDTSIELSTIINQAVNGACNDDKEAFQETISQAKLSLENYQVIKKKIAAEARNVNNLIK